VWICGPLTAILIVGLSGLVPRSFASGQVAVGRYGQRASVEHSIGKGRIEVHGKKFWFECAGSGSPTVIFEAGGGLDSTEWVDVQPEVAKTTRACAYDRLGEGQSDPVRPGVLQTVDSQAEVLRALLEAARIKPPYVLVGHSWGGGTVQRFAFDYRSAVAGVVLVDSVEADVLYRWRAMLPPPPKKGIDPAAGARAELTQAFDPKTSPEHFDVAASVRQLRKVTSLGSLPLIVLTAGTSQIAAELPPPYAARSYRIWQEAQAQLASLSSDSVHAVDSFSQHMIPTEDPTAVVAATNQAVRAARKHERLPRCATIFAGVTGINCL